MSFLNTTFQTDTRDGNFLGRAGDRLAAHHIWGDHLGTLNYDGRVWACSYRFKGIRLVSFEDFSGGKAVTNLGHVGNLSRKEVLDNYSKLAGKNYDILVRNCEHIDNYVRGLGYTSPQIARAALLVASLVLIAAARR